VKILTGGLARESAIFPLEKWQIDLVDSRADGRVQMEEG
jgi:hypothetical protein